MLYSLCLFCFCLLGFWVLGVTQGPLLAQCLWVVLGMLRDPVVLEVTATIPAFIAFTLAPSALYPTLRDTQYFRRMQSE